MFLEHDFLFVLDRDRLYTSMIPHRPNKNKQTFTVLVIIFLSFLTFIYFYKKWHIFMTHLNLLFNYKPVI